MINRIIIFLFIVFCSFFWMSNNIDTEWCCKYVSARNGVNVRAEPSINSEIVASYSYGEVVLFDEIHQTDDSVVLYIDNEFVEGKWLEVEYNTYGHDGYVFDAYLVDELEEIPENSLYYHYELMLPNYYLYYDEGMFDIKNHSGKHFNCRCGAYYQKNKTLPNLRINDEYVEVYEEGTFMDTIQDYLEIEKIKLQDYVHLKLKNGYEIDTVYQPIQNNTNPEINDFYLQLNNGDSLHVKDVQTEVYMYKNYIGEIKNINAYLIENVYEESLVFAIDKNTGKQTFLSEGIPYFSPDGQQIVSFSDVYLFQNDFSGSVSVVKKNKEDQFLKIYFKSWMPSLKIGDAFWISNEEIIVKVFPIDNKRFNHKEINAEYLKIRILF